MMPPQHRLRHAALAPAVALAITSHAGLAHAEPDTPAEPTTSESTPPVDPTPPSSGDDGDDGDDPARTEALERRVEAHSRPS
ncbi:MAG: hypothetical protein U0168_05370 [Nannocystaceae bacterium]